MKIIIKPDRPIATSGQATGNVQVCNQIYKPSFYNYLTTLENGVAVLYNVLSGAMFEVSPEEMDCLRLLESEGYTHLSEDMKNTLVENSFLIPAETNELAIIREGNLARRFDPNKYILCIMPTLDCNFDCKYCYEPQPREKGFLQSDVREGIKQYLEKIVPNATSLSVPWYGGEPMLDFPLIEEVNRYALTLCEKQGCQFTSDITTNGYLFTDAIVQKIDDLHIKYIQITVDGPKVVHDKYRYLCDGSGTFDVIFENILKILRYTQATIFLRINVDVNNYQHIPELLAMIPEEFRSKRLRLFFRSIVPRGAEFAGDEKVEELQSKYVTDLFVSSLKEGFHIYVPRIKNVGNYCESCLSNHYIVHPTGKLFKCTVELGDNDSIGTLLANGEIALNQARANKWLAEAAGDDLKCTQCQFLPLCQGGCRRQKVNGIYQCPPQSRNLQGFANVLYHAAIFNRAVD